jgi:hypothetical protein
MDYSKLKLDDLRELVEDRNIICKGTKNEIIKYLKLDDDGLYIKESHYEKTKDGFIIGIDIRNQKEFTQIGKLIEKKDAYSLNRFSIDKVYYFTKQKLI